MEEEVVSQRHETNSAEEEKEIKEDAPMNDNYCETSSLGVFEEILVPTEILIPEKK